MLKIIFKNKKKYYFNIFFKTITFKNNHHYYTPKHNLKRKLQHSKTQSQKEVAMKHGASDPRKVVGNEG